MRIKWGQDQQHQQQEQKQHKVVAFYEPFVNPQIESPPQRRFYSILSTTPLSHPLTVKCSSNIRQCQSFWYQIELHWLLILPTIIQFIIMTVSHQSISPYTYRLSVDLYSIEK